MGALTDQVTGSDTRSDDRPAVDGRKKRWAAHKLARRAELADGALAAIRHRGSAIGMEEIASEIGVSKTVLYRYFDDKADLTSAATLRFMETRLAPELAAVLGRDLDEFGLAEAAISTYVRTVADEPEIYPFVMGMTGSGPGVRDAVATSEKVIAEMLAAALQMHLQQRDMTTEGAVTWAYGVVGAVQLATHRWMSDRSSPVDELIEHLLMLAWGAIEAIAKAKGSRADFMAAEHVLPE